MLTWLMNGGSSNVERYLRDESKTTRSYMRNDHQTKREAIQVYCYCYFYSAAVVSINLIDYNTTITTSGFETKQLTPFFLSSRSFASILIIMIIGADGDVVLIVAINL